jgi:two-component system chemotaxis response regulator CheB
MAASAGGLFAISRILDQLPSAFPVPIVIVQHLDPKHPSLMATILDRRTALKVKEAEEGDRLVPGVVFLAPPDHHLLVNPDRTLSLTRTELVHFVRPSADLLFESVAGSHRGRAIAVVLSGSGGDGSFGLQAIRKTGGVVIVQDGAEFSGMPAAALQSGPVHFIASAEEIPKRLIELVMKEVAI